ncbi:MULTISPECIES: SH3 domain-containing C40 family peptidase [unclassified Campylobacter]|uniref:SH3 domain-containing C40 family peptidase n=1 Tax=unclassified Campylobacter TaxID=2593542 RepID=UPI0022E9E0B6|nr:MULTISPECIES: SH3 domain-containing C40 family peptidase [unclassified Campylobacter]MDA3053937.1 SH3 domain-containing protein [Campylobacter sp. VBCF_07 NA4]MDA3060176.1 SH3 domain-containing protein [Campylobacter sp. VBCF_02 NA5]MDA3069690.1 SH3 domain-containing protein [Campylobacter sp. VBCF_08 NA3]WBR54978.1 SH3 domain-containing protein [Campylobacter sp. VBCF_01 NA2]
MRRQILIFITFMWILAGCASHTPQKSKFIPENPEVLALEFEQSAEILPPVSAQSVASGENFKEKYFRVWDAEKITASPKDAFWGLNYAKGRHFDLGGNIYTQAVYDAMHENANKKALGSVNIPAITIKNTLLRNIPSDMPIFGDPSEPGEGEPFDYAANSALGVGYPLFISHFSKDGVWAFVQNDGVWGWVKTSDVQEMGINGASAYKNSKFIAILQDNAPIFDENRREIFRARTGTILPYDFAGGGLYGGKMISKEGVRAYFVEDKFARIWPAELNSENAKLISASLIGQKYGWGGYKLLRDCSLLTKDFLANFGLWLPRNSKAQSKRGRTFSLANLSASEKLNLIKTHAKPYASVIYMPGHVMLYVGEIEGAPAVLHNVWGLRRMNKERAVIGKTAITSLSIGEDRADIAEDRLLISRISAFSVLSEDDGVSIRELFGLEK